MTPKIVFATSVAVDRFILLIVSILLWSHQENHLCVSALAPAFHPHRSFPRDISKGSVVTASVGRVASTVVTVAAASGSAVVEEPFDFSSTSGWNRFYQDQQQVVEWHSSVPLDAVAELAVSSGQSTPTSVIVLGCGNSNLPIVIQGKLQQQQQQQQQCDLQDKTSESSDPSMENTVICFDSSQECLDQLRDRFDKISGTQNSMRYVCGDATRLPESIGHHPQGVGVIVDKGLIDAIMCGEGWNTPVSAVLEGSAAVLTNGGIYVLVCYKLSSSTKRFLSSIGERVGLQWTFDDETLSNSRVSVSIGTKSQ